jgi:hypothetical protein
MQQYETDAGVAELADALDSKSSDRKIVWVRAPPPAGSRFDIGRWTFGVRRSEVSKRLETQENGTRSSATPGQPSGIYVQSLVDSPLHLQ